MELTVNRLLHTDRSTIGTFEINGKLTCYCMEPANPIPAGRYRVVAYDSPAHKRNVPRLINVPGHSFIEIHVGNVPKDSLGCLLLANKLVSDILIQDSKTAVEAFYKVFFAEIDKGNEVWITYRRF